MNKKRHFLNKKIFYADLRKTKNELSGKSGELKTFLLISTKRLKTKNPDRNKSDSGYFASSLSSSRSEDETIVIFCRLNRLNKEISFILTTLNQSRESDCFIHSVRLLNFRINPTPELLRRLVIFLLIQKF